MKFTKLILPMMAFIFAIGLTFATVNQEPAPEEQANDYLLINGSWEAIAEQDCDPGEFTCRVQYGVDGPIYQVYDEKDEATLKDSDSPDPIPYTP